MTKLEQLIKELCPNGVEYVKLSDVCTITKGKTPIQKAISGEYPLVVTTSERKSCNTYQFDNSAVCIPLVSSRGHGVASLNHVYFQSGKFALGNILCAVIPNDESVLSANFLYHYLEYKKDILLVPLMKGGANVSLHIDDIQRVRIPLPPIKVQNRTIEILDKFVELSEVLTNELTARKKQYEYYRDMLLDFGVHGGGTSECEWRTLGDVAEVTDYVANGSFASLRENVTYKRNPDFAALIRTVDFSNGFDRDQMIYIDENAYKFLEKSRLFGGEIIINNIGAGVGNSFLCPMLDIKMSLAPNAVMLKTNNNKFYFYWLNSKYGKNALSKIISKSAMPKFNKTGLRGIMLPVPPIDEQERIVSILDRFDKLCNDISEGLPAEIEARRKQYEYYRDKLLSFDVSNI